MTENKETYELGIRTKKGFLVCYNQTSMDLSLMKTLCAEKRRWRGENWQIKKTKKIIKTIISYE